MCICNYDYRYGRHDGCAYDYEHDYDYVFDYDYECHQATPSQPDPFQAILGKFKPLRATPGQAKPLQAIARHFKPPRFMITDCKFAVNVDHSGGA